MGGGALCDREAIAGVCEKHSVARLRAFGSAVMERFDPATSDVGFLVEAAAVRNPYFARGAFSETVDLHAA